ncbi:hypothetical protein BC835DRAFT_1308998 [Cytidiella melzeri]|nr:hypothetical protein BC835DRAFT_1308998 [Cytidiella melzeri]
MAGPQNHRAKRGAAQRAREGRAQARFALQETHVTRTFNAVSAESDAGSESEKSSPVENKYSYAAASDCIDGLSNGESDTAGEANGEVLQDVEEEMPELQVEDEESELEVEELEGEELDQSLRRRGNQRQAWLDSAFSSLVNKSRSAHQWNKIEQTRMEGYNGLSKRTKHHQKQIVRNKEERDSHSQQSKEAHAFCAFFAPAKQTKSDTLQSCMPAETDLDVGPHLLVTGSMKTSTVMHTQRASGSQGEATDVDLDGFLSDLSEDGEDLFDDDSGADNCLLANQQAFLRNHLICAIIVVVCNVVVTHIPLRVPGIIIRFAHFRTGINCHRLYCSILP